MNKALVISRVFPPRVGGSGNWMWDLYSRMPAGEFIVAAGVAPGSAAFDQRHELRVVRMGLDFNSWGALGWRRGADYLDAYRRLAKLAREEGVGAVHAACCLPEGFLAWLIARRLKIPYLVYVHGEELNVMRSSRELSWMARRVFRAAALVIANSHNTVRLIQADCQVIASRLRVVSPGVDTERFRPAVRDAGLRTRLGWGERRVVLTVGRLQPRKGHAAMIRSLPAIKKTVPDVLYAIVGDGAEREALGQLVEELALGAHVRFHGELASDELPALYQQCDLFVLPNREVAGDIEGFGIVLLEAQACGKPVIAGDSGGTAEAVGAPHAGYVINCCDSAVLASAVSDLLTDAHRRQRMGAAAREWTVNYCDWQICCAAARAAFAAVDEGEMTLAKALV